MDQYIGIYLQECLTLTGMPSQYPNNVSETPPPVSSVPAGKDAGAGGVGNEGSSSGYADQLDHASHGSAPKHWLQWHRLRDDPGLTGLVVSREHARVANKLLVDFISLDGLEDSR